MATLPRLPKQIKIVNPVGWVSDVFQRWWQQVADAIEATDSGLADAIDAIQTAEADIIAIDTVQTSQGGDITSLKAPQYLTLALSGVLANERRLVGGTGVAITDGGANGDATIDIDTVTDLGYTPANKAGETFTGAVDVQAALRCDSLRIDQAASASTATVTHSVPIDLSGTTYYIILSSTP